MRVLIVDDSIVMRMVLERALRHACPKVSAMMYAADGAEALATLEQAAADGEQFDLILSDIHMPVMDGLEFLLEVQRRRLAPRVPIVMITADPKQADRVSGELKRIADVRTLSAVSGAYDMMAIVEADTTARMDAVLDRIGKAMGVARTVSSIILSEKFSR